ncbi:leucine-rich repeat-containing G-protein coupled receptor 6 [Rhinichthys klamathensis goyatoka]|uniref:leucine-rich repeat-containing G-protein coupled receptor 6 n=1 Tax=Rhinichthys klamathensis goyatoka TaxID=3034132 RepID=UPI0024B4D40D|nr:leucine-rich repeat-containing G-protein coupled receptor 6 [Rhinichthys klamathensis goyatoka]
MLVVLLILHAVSCAHSHGPPGATVPVKQCPSACQCEEDGILLLVDCSEQGLSSVPPDLSPLTSYLDLSMNNISEIQPNAFHNLRFLSELRLSGNHLRHIPGPVLQGLYNLKVLMLQNNQLERLPSEDPWELPNLLSLRLDANLIMEVPARTLLGMRSLRHLWLDDNALTEIPISALNDLSSLQAMTLALNRITHIPDYAFRNLSNLVVLHLHNNMIRTLGQNCFEGLHSLETLELNFNELQEFPVAIRTLAKLQELGFHNNNIKAIPERAFVGNPLLQTIHFYENPIQFVGRSAFQFLPKLHTLSLNGATEIREFPDLKGTTSLQVLTLTRAGLTGLPHDLCHLLPKLRVLELSHNVIEELPSFYHCASLQEIGLQHNLIKQIEMNTFQQLSSLRSLDLSWNRINTIHPDAFSSLQSLIKLDLTGNRLSSLPLAGLTSLTHLKLKGNMALSRSFREEDFPNIRVIEMPFAYQCCVFGACNSYKAASQWEEQMGSEEEDLQKKALSLFPIHTDNNYDLDLEEFQLAIEESKLQTSIQCTPIPGPFKPCDNLFDSWVVRLGMWLISLVSLTGNSLLLLTVFASPSYLSPVKFIIGTISGANLLTGLCTGTLALVDARTFGEFALHGAQWEMGAGCQTTGFLSVLASEGSILFLTLAAVQCSVSVSCARAYGKSPSLGSVRAASVACLALSLAVAALPLIGVGEYGATPLCTPSPLPDGEPSTLGFMVALIMMNSLCFLVITGTYIKLYWDLTKGDFDSIWDCAMIKHVAWLIFTNCLLYCPVAFLTFSSLLGLFPVSEEVVKSVVLVLLPLPASINPLLYLLFNPHFREDARLLFRRAHHHHDHNLDSFVSVDTEKSSYDSTQALVSFAAEADAVFESSSAPNPDTVGRFSCPPSVPLIPCQMQMKPSTERESIGENLVRSTPELIAKEQEYFRSSGLETHNGNFFSGVYHSPILSARS